MRHTAAVMSMPHGDMNRQVTMWLAAVGDLHCHLKTAGRCKDGSKCRLYNTPVSPLAYVRGRAVLHRFHTLTSILLAP